MGLLRRTAEHADRFRSSLPERRVFPTTTVEEIRAALDRPLPQQGEAPEQVIDDLVAIAEPGIVATAGPRYFGFVIGGTLPAALAADWLVAAWDAPLDSRVLSPAGQAIEAVAARWALEALALPPKASVGFVTGATMASFVGLAAARHRVLADVGWDVEEDGLAGSPPIRVVAGEEVHIAVLKALRMLGVGSRRVIRVPADGNGAMRASELDGVLRAGDGPTIVCVQAGNVDTGASDPLGAIADTAHAHGAWVHVDGAFGLWAAASPAMRHLVEGVERADSWGCDGHKWLNVPYDSGFAFCSRPSVHAAVISYSAEYLVGSGVVHGGAEYTLESSRRARGFTVWAAIRELGRDGVADLVERCCRLARRFADGLTEAGVEVVNDVVLNQVLVSFGDDTRTEKVITAIQEDGTCWMGATTWRGRRLMRISVSNATTTESDVDRSIEAILRVLSST